MVMRVSREGVSMLIRQLVGADATGTLHNFSVVYTGLVHRGRISGGHERLSLDLTIAGAVYRIRSRGRFRGRRTGDLCCLPQAAGPALSPRTRVRASPGGARAGSGRLASLAAIVDATGAR
jgi:hypothetical protein